MAAGFTVGAALLFGALSLVPASRNHDARESDRAGIVTLEKHQNNVLLIWPTSQRWRGRDITLWAVAARGAAPAPRGVERMPVPGEAFVSPALAELMQAPHGEELGERFRAHVVGLVGDGALVYPDELFAYVGKPAGMDLSGRPVRLAVTSIGRAPSSPSPLDLTALLATVALACAVLIPIWFFIATATRLSAATRQMRLAAVRLAGATATQVRYLAGVEAGMAALVGALAGYPVFLAARPLLADGVVLGRRFFPSDFAPPLLGVVAVLVGLPVVAVVITLVSMRRLVISPLGVSRPQRRRSIRSAWPAVLAIGVGLLWWLAAHASTTANNPGLKTEVLVGTALTLTILGLSGTAIWLAWLVARRSGERARSASTLLAMRRLEADPSAAMRMVGGVAVLITLAGVIQAGLRADNSPDGPPSLVATWVTELPEDTVVAEPFQPEDAPKVAALTNVPGVTSLKMVKPVVTGGTRATATTAIIQTDGSPDTLERLRERVGWVADVNTPAEWTSVYGSVAVEEYERIDELVTTTTIFLLLVIAANYLVAAVDWIIERRRALAVLSAVGTGRAVLAKVLLLQIGLPLTTSAVLGYLGAIVVIALLYRATETTVVFPLAQLATLTLVVVGGVLTVTVLTLPWISQTRDPELLHGE
jgi:predicted lysophospholipase L1 biosynthesis ABC-type transport system permease subunit